MCRTFGWTSNNCPRVQTRGTVETSRVRQGQRTTEGSRCVTPCWLQDLLVWARRPRCMPALRSLASRLESNWTSIFESKKWEMCALITSTKHWFLAGMINTENCSDISMSTYAKSNPNYALKEASAEDKTFENRCYVFSRRKGTCLFGTEPSKTHIFAIFIYFFQWTWNGKNDHSY